MENLNGHYISTAEDDRLLALILPTIAATSPNLPDDQVKTRLQAGIAQLKIRAKTINELAESAMFYVVRPQFPLVNAKAAKLLQGDARIILDRLGQSLADTAPWTADHLESHLRHTAESMELGLGKLAQPLRAALTGSNASPSIFEIMEILGEAETLERISAVPDTSDDA